jgi:hypothetical protein
LLAHEYSQEILEAKSPRITLRRQYQYLEIIRWPLIAVRRNLLDVLILLKSRGVPFGLPEANLAAKNGYFRILNWLESQGILPDARGANGAAKFDQFEALTWVRSRGIYPTRSCLSGACYRGQLEVLKWLSTEVNLRPGPLDVEAAVKRNHFEIFEWSVQVGVQPTIDWATQAFLYRHARILEWLIDKKFYPSPDAVYEFCSKGQFDRVEWLLERGDFSKIESPVIEGLFQRAFNVYSRVISSYCYDFVTLRWLLDKGFQPSRNQIAGLYQRPDLEIWEWLIEAGFRPDQKTIDTMAGKVWPDASSFLISHELRPSETVLNDFLSAGKFELLELYADAKILPTRTNKSFLNALEWMESKGIPFSSYDADLARTQKNELCLDWLARRGIHPTERK